MDKRVAPCFLAAIMLILTASAWGEERVLTIPYSKQTKAYSCGQNSFLMIMGYWGSGLSKQDIFGFTGYNPTTSRNFEEIIGNNFPGYRLEYLERNIDAVISAIDLGRPVMAEVNAILLPYLDYSSSSGHYIVVVGYNSDRGIVYIRDPNSPYIEEMSYEELNEAWEGPRNKIYSIYREDGENVPPEEIVHFSDEAKPLGAEKTEESSSILALFIPSVFTVFNTGETGMKDTRFLDDWLYTVKIQGLFFGHLSLDRSPWLFQDKEFHGLGANLGFNFGRTSLLFGNSDTFSTGVFRGLETKTLNARFFNTTKNIEGLTAPWFSLEGSYFMALPILQFPNPYLNIPFGERNAALELLKLRGGRVGIRRGINQNWGYLSAAGSLTSALASVNGYTNWLNVLGGDITLAPLEFAIQYHYENFDDGTEAYVLAYSIGVNLNSPKMSGGIFTVIDFMGFTRAYFRFKSETFVYDVPATEIAEVDVDTRSIKLELPMSLKIVDLVYGFDVDWSQGSYSGFSLGARALFNQLLPYFQGHIGYNFRHGTDGDNIHSLNIGIYAGLW